MLVRCLLILVLVSAGCGPAPPDEAKRVLRLGTTTSTRDSGLLDALLPEFEARHSVRVDVIAAGTGKALRLAEAGDVDVVLVHARADEDAFMAAGHGVRRVDVMYNAFEILGPAADGGPPCAASRSAAPASCPAQTTAARTSASSSSGAETCRAGPSTSRRDRGWGAR